eukprot:sb/3478999/
MACLNRITCGMESVSPGPNRDQNRAGKAGTDRNKYKTTNQNSLFRSRDCLSANQGPVFPHPLFTSKFDAKKFYKVVGGVKMVGGCSLTPSRRWKAV